MYIKILANHKTRQDTDKRPPANDYIWLPKTVYMCVWQANTVHVNQTMFDAWYILVHNYYFNISK